MTMRYTILCLLGISLILSGVDSRRGGDAEVSERMSEGDNISIRQMPFVVSISTVTGRLLCGGALISQNVVLTAAQCVHKKKLRNLMIRMGSEYYLYGGIMQMPKKIYIHKQYDPNTWENDIALLVLPRNVPLSADISTVSLCDHKPHVEEFVYVAGWGKNTKYSRFSKKLVQQRFPVTPFEKCKSSYKRGNNIDLPDSMFCASYTGSRISLCDGDTGSPASVKNRNNKYEVCGVALNGDQCGSNRQISRFTDVYRYRSWIESKMRKINGMKQ